MNLLYHFIFHFNVMFFMPFLFHFKATPFSPFYFHFKVKMLSPFLFHFYLMLFSAFCFHLNVNHFSSFSFHINLIILVPFFSPLHGSFSFTFTWFSCFFSSALCEKVFIFPFFLFVLRDFYAVFLQLFCFLFFFYAGKR